MAKKPRPCPELNCSHNKRRSYSDLSCSVNAAKAPGRATGACRRIFCLHARRAFAGRRSRSMPGAYTVRPNFFAARGASACEQVTVVGVQAPRSVSRGACQTRPESAGALLLCARQIATSIQRIQALLNPRRRTVHVATKRIAHSDTYDLASCVAGGEIPTHLGCCMTI